MNKMKYAKHNDSISFVNVDTCTWNVRVFLFNKGYTLKESERMVYALDWYIVTGRAPIDFLHRFVNAAPSKVGNVIIKHYSYLGDDRLLDMIKRALGCDY